MERRRDGGYVEYDEWSALAARLADTEAAMLTALSPFGVEFVDPPDGGDVSPAEQLQRMANALVDARADNARLREDAARLVRAENLLSTFRDHAFIPELLERDVEEIDAFLSARAQEARDDA